MRAGTRHREHLLRPGAARGSGVIIRLMLRVKIRGSKMQIEDF